MFKLVLASASPRRKALLEQIGIDYAQLIADIDESAAGYNHGGKYAMEMSRQKAAASADKLVEAIESGTGEPSLCPRDSYYVLGADTIVELDGNILGKPQDDEDAFRVIEKLQGKWHQVITGITLVHAGSMKAQTESETTQVKIRPMTQDMIRAYLNTGEHRDKAGSYGIQGFGSVLVEKIDGCYFNVMGLPIHRLTRMLENMGFPMLSWMK